MTMEFLKLQEKHLIYVHFTNLPLSSTFIISCALRECKITLKPQYTHRLHLFSGQCHFKMS